jgi:hypothetical protein
MNSPHETQLADDLRQLASAQPFTPDLAAIRQRAQQRHHRGRMLRNTTAVAAGAAVLAVGGAFAAMHAAGGNPAGTSAGKNATVSAPVETVAYVTARVQSALGNVNDYIVRADQVQTGPGGDSSTNWIDPRTNNDYEVLQDSTVGKSIAWLSTYLVKRVLTWKDVEADFATHTWSVSVIHAAGPIQGSTAGATSTVTTPAEIKTWLDAGKLKIIGHKQVNGHEAIGLRQTWADGYRELWVDAKTFLPLRYVTADFAKESGPQKNVMLVGNETWLPRTKALLDMVNHVHIPAGFTQVAPPQ